MSTLFSCGFAYEKHVTGKYYIIGVDTQTELHLSYRLNSGDYIGKAPGRLLQYGYNDTFLVAKTIDYKDSTVSYYIIDMSKDYDVAIEETFRVGPINDAEYNKTWKERLGIELTRTKR